MHMQLIEYKLNANWTLGRLRWPPWPWAQGEAGSEDECFWPLKLPLCFQIIFYLAVVFGNLKIPVEKRSKDNKKRYLYSQQVAADRCENEAGHNHPANMDTKNRRKLHKMYFWREFNYKKQTSTS